MSHANRMLSSLRGGGGGENFWFKIFGPGWGGFWDFTFLGFFFFCLFWGVFGVKWVLGVGGGGGGGGGGVVWQYWMYPQNGKINILIEKR